MLEGEFAYDHGLNFDESYRNVINGNIVAIEHTAVGVTQGAIGPKIQRPTGHLHPYATLKAGFVDFRLSPSLLPYINVASSIFGIRTCSLNAALYLAGGISATVGPLGLRFEAGDEIYFNSGPHHNLRITFGPIIRF